MLGGSQERRSLHGIDESRHAKEKSIRRIFGAQAGAVFNAGFSQPAREAEHAGQRANIFLLPPGELRERAVLGVWFRAAMVAHGPAQSVPLLRSPARRNCKSSQESSRGFLRRFCADAGPHSMQTRGGTQYPSHGWLRERGRSLRAAHRVE